MLRTILPRMTIRERLSQGAAADLTDEELVALLLSTGLAGTDALDLSRRLLARFGDLRGLGRASIHELMAEPGLGPAKACRVQAALELGMRNACRRIDPCEPIRSSQQVVREFGPRLSQLDREHFYVLLLDAKHRKIKDVLVSVGTLDAAIVHPREVFRPAVAESAAAVIVVHNHPSGDPTPSEEDRMVTRRLAATGDLLGVDLLDHVIVGKSGSVSLRDAGELA